MIIVLVEGSLEVNFRQYGELKSRAQQKSQQVISAEEKSSQQKEDALA